MLFGIRHQAGRYANSGTRLPAGWRGRRMAEKLDLGLKVELVDANGDVVKVPPRNGTVRSSRQKMRIITPEGDVFFNNIQWKTLGQVILYAGAERVKEMNFLSAGMPLVSNHLFSNNNYVQYQHEIAPNVFLFNYSDTKKKAEIIYKKYLTNSILI